MQKRIFLVLVAVLAIISQNGLQAQTPVSLSTAVSPAAGQPGVTSINVTGSGFPTGTILPASTTVSLQAVSGGPIVTAPATAVTTIAGTSRRVTFTIPNTIAVTTPTAYRIGIA